MTGTLIIRTNLDRLTTPGEPPRIGFELKYPGTTVRGYLASKLQREVWKFLKRENYGGDVLLRSNAPSLDESMRLEMLAMQKLVELSIRDQDGGAIVSEELMTR